MHNYSVGSRYTTKTKLGNWYEEEELNNYHFKEFLHQKQNSLNLTLNSAQQLQFSQSPAELSPNNSHLLSPNHLIQLANTSTQAVLAFNINQPILGEKTFAVTTSKFINPALRNVFRIEAESQSNSIRFGEKIRLIIEVEQQKLYLQSMLVSPMRGSKLSREQEVSMTANKNSNSVWVIEHWNPALRVEKEGQEINVNEPILIKHVLTAQWLASQKIPYINQFGVEYEVFAKSYLTNNKTQNLSGEKNGHHTVESPLRAQHQQNEWRIITAK